MKTQTADFTGKCEQCGDPITPASNQAQFNRNRGLHMFKAHGKRSPMYHAAKKYRKNRSAKLAEVETNGNGSSHRFADMLTAPPKPKRKYVKRTPAVATVSSPTTTSQVVPAHLDHCPNCKTRFYMAKGVE